MNLLNWPLMNILIEDAEKLEYLTSSNHWSKKPENGKIFQTTEAAVVVAKQQQIGKFNIVAYMSTTEQFINMSKGRGAGNVEDSAV